jgi:hypothetical protein
MKKAKFVQDAKLDPSRYYRNPADIMRDRRLTNEDRLAILETWERDARQRYEDQPFTEPAAEQLQQFRRMREELERCLDTSPARESVPGAGDQA